jgi:hypothetical protein
MNKEELKQIIYLRSEAREQFEADFRNAETLQELTQAYATYTGKLEATIDMIEIIQTAKFNLESR